LAGGESFLARLHQGGHALARNELAGFCAIFCGASPKKIAQKPASSLRAKKQRNLSAQPEIPLPEPASLTNLSRFVSDAGF